MRTQMRIIIIIIELFLVDIEVKRIRTKTQMSKSEKVTAIKVKFWNIGPYLPVFFLKICLNMKSMAVKLVILQIVYFELLSKNPLDMDVNNRAGEFIYWFSQL